MEVSGDCHRIQTDSQDHEWLALGRGDSEGWEEVHLVLEEGQTAPQVGLGVWQI